MPQWLQNCYICCVFIVYTIPPRSKAPIQEFQKPYIYNVLMIYTTSRVAWGGWCMPHFVKTIIFTVFLYYTPPYGLLVSQAGRGGGVCPNFAKPLYLLCFHSIHHLQGWPGPQKHAFRAYALRRPSMARRPARPSGHGSRTFWCLTPAHTHSRAKAFMRVALYTYPYTSPYASTNIS